MAGTAFSEKDSARCRRCPNAPRLRAPGLEIVFRPDPTIGDGALANNAWLQELPKPPNKMTWDNAVWISPRTAQRLGVNTGDVLALSIEGRKAAGPVLGAAGAGRRIAHGPFGIRPHARRTRREMASASMRTRCGQRGCCGHGVAASRSSALRKATVRHHAAHANHGGARSVPHGDVRRISPETPISRRPKTSTCRPV